MEFVNFVIAAILFIAVGIILFLLLTCLVPILLPMVSGETAVAIVGWSSLIIDVIITTFTHGFGFMGD